MLQVLTRVQAEPVKKSLPKELSILITDLSSDPPTHMLALYSRHHQRATPPPTNPSRSSPHTTSFSPPTAPSCPPPLPAPQLSAIRSRSPSSRYASHPRRHSPDYPRTSTPKTASPCSRHYSPPIRYCRSPSKMNTPSVISRNAWRGRMD
jgi:hypothetical protein